MQLTVAICTWNRSALLDKTLERLAEIQVASDLEWEVIVINNNCSDDTDDVVEKYMRLLPLKLVHEAKPGLSNARNRAIEEATASWILFTDDDVLVSDFWLDSYAKAIDSAADDVAFLGGEVFPWFEVEPSEALVKAIPTVSKGFCGADLPAKMEIEFPDERMPVGANFAIKKDVLNGLLFDPDLGVSQGVRLSSEELQFMKSLVRNGLKGQWVEDASVKHFVPKSRISLPYLVKHIHGLGRTKVIVKGVPPGKCVLGCPVWILRQAVSNSVLAPLNFVTGRSAAFYKNVSLASSRFGMLRECLGSRKSDG